ncbi:S8 family serine peptidase [Candidatus Bipolaricaulota bacterium]|nr:S8 family serine peptidase [Candidatus Bipolaricaulota bacterium]
MGLFREVQAAERQRDVGQNVESVTAVLQTLSDATDEDIERLTVLGYTVLGAYGRFILVNAPATYFGDAEIGLAVLDFVTNASLPPQTLTDADLITNGTAAIGADEVWDLGYRGQGTVIAVIDDGFDLDNADLANLSPSLYTISPSPDQIGSYAVDEGVAAQATEHGTSCAIIVGDVAPDAELHLLSFPQGTQPLGWICALHYATHVLQADIVTTSMEMGASYCHSDGTGPVNELVSAILEGTDTIFTIASGNWASGGPSARWHYEATFLDTDGDNNHDFTANASGAWDRNTLRFSANKDDEIIIFMEWDDWDVAAHREDFDLYILDGTYGIVVAESKAQQYGGTGNPTEGIYQGFTVPATGDYCIRIRNNAVATYGEDARAVHINLYAFNQSNAFGTVEHTNACGSIREIATHPLAIAVGAVSPDDWQVRAYSSRGAVDCSLVKPELYGPDGVTGTAYDLFYGTSAAAPYVAGALALLRSLDPDITADQAVAILQATAVTSEDDCGNTVYAIDVPAAIQELLKE